MKRVILTLFIPCLLVIQDVAADLDSGIFGSEEMVKPEEKRRPFNVVLSYDNVCSSHFSKRRFRRQSQRFSEAEAELGAVYFYTPCFEEGGKISAGYTYTDFDWKQNPYFRQNHFNVATIELGFATKRLSGWLWQANFSMNLDMNHCNVNKYANYDILLWGRYSWGRCFGYHVGFLAYTGMNVNRVWPVIGFDWTINRKWKLNMVYPLNISLVYDVNSKLSLALAGRAFINRYRVGQHEHIPLAIFEYRNSGGEFAVNYQWRPSCKVNLHVGRTIGGLIRISNQNHHHIRNLNIDGACYFGANLDYSF